MIDVYVLISFFSRTFWCTVYQCTTDSTEKDVFLVHPSQPTVCYTCYTVGGVGMVALLLLSEKALGDASNYAVYIKVGVIVLCALHCTELIVSALTDILYERRTD
jgi:hypothetical protein